MKYSDGVFVSSSTLSTVRETGRVTEPRDSCLQNQKHNLLFQMESEMKKKRSYLLVAHMKHALTKRVVWQTVVLL